MPIFFENMLFFKKETLHSTAKFSDQSMLFSNLKSYLVYEAWYGRRSVSVNNCKAIITAVVRLSTEKSIDFEKELYLQKQIDLSVKKSMYSQDQDFDLNESNQGRKKV